MGKFRNHILVKYSQKLRREMTKAEKHLWYDFLKKLPITFHRQKVLGPCITDFYCAAAKLVIELDGSQHYEEKGEAADRERDLYFRENGIRVLRYSNLQLKQNFQGVCADIMKHIGLEDA